VREWTGAARDLGKQHHRGGKSRAWQGELPSDDDEEEKGDN